MGINKENIARVVPEHLETDHEFVRRLDSLLKDAWVPVSRAEVSDIIDGDYERYQKEASIYYSKIRINAAEIERLKEIRQLGNGLNRQTRLLLKQFHHTESYQSMHQKQIEVHRKWKDEVSKLSYGSYMGAAALREAYYLHSNALASIDKALHEKDYELAGLILSEIDIGKKANRENGQQYARKKLYKIDDEITLDEIPSHILRLRLALGSSQVENKPWDYSSLEDEFIVKPIDAPKQAAYYLGHSDLYEQLTVRIPIGHKAIDRCVQICPPDEVVVIVHEPALFWSYDLSIPFHESGHGIHFVGMSKDTFFVERISLSAWNEAMAFLYEDLMLEPMC